MLFQALCEKQLLPLQKVLHCTGTAAYAKLSNIQLLFHLQVLLHQLDLLLEGPFY